MRIPEEKIREVQAKADIVSVMSKYAKLQKKGQDYVGLCLFHQDNNPSMSVSPVKHFFKCFSCGVGGNVIDFLMKYKHISFVEAIVELANEFNVDLGDIQLTAKKEKYTLEQKTIFEINQEAMKYYQVNLNASVGSDAKKYLTKRKIDANQLKQWEVGYAVGNELVEHLTNIGYLPKQIVDAGLATKKDNGVFDYFVNRIVFPIKNQDGYVIGFSGRILTDEKPKYLNTRETLVFKKSDILFNLDNVWKIKERLDSIILLEGFMDVISLEKIGVNNAMALMGTAFSNFHLQILLELRKPIKLFLDGDDPGVQAMYKIAETLIKNNLKFSIIDNISNKDPDELVNQGKSNEVLKMIEEPINPYIYFLNKFVANKKVLGLDENNEIIEKILELLKNETNYILVDQVLTTLANKLNISKDALEKQLGQKTVKHFETSIVQPKSSATKRMRKTWDKYEIGRNRIFISLLKSPDYLDKTEPLISQIAGADFTFEKILKNLINFYHSKKYEGNDLTKFFTLVNKEDFINEEIDLLHEIIEDPMRGFESNNELKNQEFLDIIKEFKIRDLEKQQFAMQNNLKNLEAKQAIEKDPIKKEIIKEQMANSQIRSKKLIDRILELKQKES